MHPTDNHLASTICRTTNLGLIITNATTTSTRTRLYVTPTNPINQCPTCTNPGKLRDTTTRTLIDLPIVGYPTELIVSIPRYQCTTTSCTQTIFRARLECAKQGAKVTNRVAYWILKAMAIDNMSIKAIAQNLGLGWDLTWKIAQDACASLARDPDRLRGVRIIGVDEHRWSHNRSSTGGGYVTVIVDMTPSPGNQHTPARLLDVIEGRSNTVLSAWINTQPAWFRSCIEIVTMDGFTGYATWAKQQFPQADRVMDPFHVVRLAGDKVTGCRQRLQQETCGRRGRKDDPLYKNRKTLLTSKKWVTGTGWQRLDELFDCDQSYQQLYETWVVYQDIIDCYAERDKRRGRRMMVRVINRLAGLTGTGIVELEQLGRTLARRRDDVLAYFTSGASNGPVEAINGRLEHLRGIALGFRNSMHYILRCLIHSGGLLRNIHAL